jgi:hypothetical protein
MWNYLVVCYGSSFYSMVLFTIYWKYITVCVTSLIVGCWNEVCVQSTLLFGNTLHKVESVYVSRLMQLSFKTLLYMHLTQYNSHWKSVLPFLNKKFLSFLGIFCSLNIRTVFVYMYREGSLEACWLILSICSLKMKTYFSLVDVELLASLLVDIRFFLVCVLVHND